MSLNLNLSDDAPEPGPEKDVVRLTKQQEMRVGILSEGIRGVYVHWNAGRGLRGRSEPCLKERCTGCRAKLPRRWKGYLYVIDEKGKETFFLEITTEAAKKLRGLFEECETLRGMSVKFSRMNGDKTRMQVEIFPKPIPLALLERHQEILPWDSLSRLWETELGGEDEAQL